MERCKPFRRRRRKLAFEAPQAEWLAESYGFLEILSRVSSIILAYLIMFLFLPSGVKSSIIEPIKTNIRRLRKSEIYDNRRFKSLLNSGALLSAVDLGTVTLKKLKTLLAMIKKKTDIESRPAHNKSLAKYGRTEAVFEH